MEIKKEEIKAAKKLLSKVPFNPTGRSKGVLFFPIDEVAFTNSDDGMMLLEKTSCAGAGSLVRAGLAITCYTDNNGKHKTDVTLAYATVEYATKFNLRDYLEIASSLSKKDINNICEYNALLLRSDYLVSEFDI